MTLLQSPLEEVIQRLRSNDSTLTFLFASSPPYLSGEPLRLGSSLRIARFVITRLQFFQPPGEGFWEALVVNTKVTCLVVPPLELEETEERGSARVLSLNSTLQTLVVDMCSLNGDWALGLGEGLAGHSALTSITIIETNSGDNGGKRIGEALNVNSTLTFLQCNFTEIGAATLGEALAVNATLTQLSLQHSSIGDLGGATFAEALAVNSSLTLLDLSFTRFGDDFTVALEDAMAVNSTLTRLDSSSTRIRESELLLSLVERNRVNHDLKSMSLFE